jgi:AcrR family transcriptional regulator
MKSASADTRAVRTAKGSGKRREQQKHELRRLILQQAGEEFVEHGYDNFSLRRVAERIGYTPTTIYLYFRNKDELLLETVQEGFNTFDQKIRDVASSHKQPLERIEALGRAYIDFGLQQPSLYRLMFMQRSDFYFMPRFVEGYQGEALNAGNDDAAVLEGDRPRTVAMQMLVDAVTDAMDQNLLRPGNPIITADVLWSGVHGLVSLAISPLMSPEHAQKVTDLLLATLIAGNSPH